VVLTSYFLEFGKLGCQCRYCAGPSVRPCEAKCIPVRPLIGRRSAEYWFRDETPGTTRNFFRSARN